MLDAGKPFFSSEPFSIGGEHVPNVLIVPLFLGDHSFGYLFFWGLSEDPDPSRLSFVRSVGHLFELMIGRVDAKKKLPDLFKFMPNPTFVINVEGSVVVWNPACELMTGWKAEKVLGRENYTHALPFYAERRPIVVNLSLNPDPVWEETYLEFIREGDNVYSLAYCPALPGGGAYLRCNTSRLYDALHRLWGAIHTVRDVTGEREMEKRFHRSESMYRAITDFAGVGIMLLNREKVLYYNERFPLPEEPDGEQITFDTLLRWTHPEDRHVLRGRFEELFRGQIQNSRFEFRAGGEEGVHHFRGYARVIEYEDKPTIHFIIDDISEQKELTRKARLNELRLYHDDRLTALGTMAAGIAHELNQPLNTIRVITDGLLFGRDAGWTLDFDELYDSLEMTSKQVMRMSRVIQTIRNFAREDRGQSNDDVNPNEAVENVLSMIGRQLEAHGIRVHKSLAPQLPCIRTQLNRLEQVIMNLIVNARQALDSCRREGKDLWIRTRTAGDRVWIEVEDNASGIPGDFLAKIFDPFFTTKEVGQGTGLGLTISQSIVADFGGAIEAFNNERGGATFCVIAPIFRG